MTSHRTSKKTVFSIWIIAMFIFDILGVILMLNDAIIAAVGSFFIASIFVVIHVKKTAELRNGGLSQSSSR